MRYRVLTNMDDFLAALALHSRASTLADCRKGRYLLHDLLKRLGIVRHPDNGCWSGTQRLEHLGMYIYTMAMRVYVSEKKVVRVPALPKRIMLIEQRNRRLVPLELYL